ncbi:hypothetical protein [Acidovorax sp. Root70]|uniref:hypothetical protein n=1 Tax=Acidovorax sp. Root70 TaxID=1736590 RepID=UPI0006F3F8FA|nr:hypothetical protein [Acidovorax sp. Root70]KRB28088.1 hypothetical protein ASD94_10070 [Acidovorax sp. Root70]
MAVESATYPSQLNTALPTAADMVSEGDDHLRLLKTVVKTTFPNVAGVISATDVQLNYVTGVNSAIQTQIDGKGAISGQTWTGPHVFPGTTTIGGLTPTIRGYLETITSDAQAQINAKGAIAGQSWSGTQNFTGATITVPTATVGDSSNKAASTAFVATAAFSAALPGQSGNAGRVVTTDGTTASWGYAILYRNYISTSSTALKGFNNVITAGGITVTLPTLADGEICQITNSSNTTTSAVDWGSTKFRGQTSPGVMTLNKLSASFLVIGTGNATYGNI